MYSEKVIMESNDSKIFYKNYGKYNVDNIIKYSLIEMSSYWKFRSSMKSI